MSKLKYTIIIAILGVFTLSSCGYNSMVNKQETVSAQWAQVENAYQRRADLIPNLVNTVKGYASHEQETFTAVVDARARATQVNVNPEELTEEIYNNSCVLCTRSRPGSLSDWQNIQEW